MEPEEKEVVNDDTAPVENPTDAPADTPAQPEVNTVIDPEVMQKYYNATVNMGWSDINQMLIASLGTFESVASNPDLSAIVILNSKNMDGELSPEEAQIFEEAMSEAPQDSTGLSDMQGVALHIISSITGKTGREIEEHAQELRKKGDMNTLFDYKAFIKSLTKGGNPEKPETAEVKKLAVVEPTINLDRKSTSNKKQEMSNLTPKQKKERERMAIEKAISTNRL